MCTIGAIKNKRTNKSYFFKNVDQTEKSIYQEPFFRQGKNHRFLKIPSSNPTEPGVLAGVNEAGLVVLGADGNCMPNYCGGQYSSLDESLVIYERILSECTTTWEAVSRIMKSYQDLSIGGNGDILIVGDRDEAVAMEYTLDCWGVQFRGFNPYLVRSNFFVLLDHLKPLQEENSLHTSSAIRYTDAMRNLSAKGRLNNLEDVFRLVRSHDQGLNAMSICRHGGDGEYFTHGSVVIELAQNAIKAYVCLNSSPCQGKYEIYEF